MKIIRIAALVAVGCLTAPVTPCVAHAAPTPAAEPYKFSCAQATRVAAIQQDNRVIDYDYAGFGTPNPTRTSSNEPPGFPTDGSPVVRLGGKGVRYIWKQFSDVNSRGVMRMEFRDATQDWKRSKPNMGWGFTENTEADEFGNIYVYDDQIVLYKPKWTSEGMVTHRVQVVSKDEVGGVVEGMFSSGQAFYFQTRLSWDPSVAGEGKLFRVAFDPVTMRRLGKIQRVDLPGVDVRRTMLTGGAGADTFFGMRDEKATLYHFNPETNKVDAATAFGDRWPGVKRLMGYKAQCTDTLPRASLFPEDADASVPGMVGYGNARESGAEIAYNTFDNFSMWGGSQQTDQVDWDKKMQWTAFTDGGRYVVGTPALVHTKKGGKFLWRRTSSGLYVRSQVGGASCTAERTAECTLEAGGLFKSDPSVVVWGDESEIAFGADQDGMLWQSTGVNAWTPTNAWQSLHTTELMKDVRVKDGTSPVAVWQQSELKIYVVTTQGLKVLSYDPEDGNVTAVASLPALPEGVELDGAPQVASYAMNTRIVVTDKNHRVFTANRRMGTWQAWTEVKFSYAVSGHATVAYTGDGRTYVFANGVEAEGAAPSRIQAVEVKSNGALVSPQITKDVPNLQYDPAPLSFRSSGGLNVGVALMTDEKVLYFALPAVPVSPNRAVAVAPQLELKGEAALPRPNKKRK